MSHNFCLIINLYLATIVSRQCLSIDQEDKEELLIVKDQLLKKDDAERLQKLEQDAPVSGHLRQHGWTQLLNYSYL